MRDYHDREWGVPSHDDRHLFEMLTLEGAQAGLSWATILNRRRGYGRAFASFDAARVAAFDDRRLERLRQDEGIIRNRSRFTAPVRMRKPSSACRTSLDPSPLIYGTGSTERGSSITPEPSPMSVPQRSYPIG